VPPFPVEQPYPTEINGKRSENYTQWFLTRHHRDRAARHLGALRFTKSGLPVGLQIVGRRRQEAAVLRAAPLRSGDAWTRQVRQRCDGRQNASEFHDLASSPEAPCWRSPWCPHYARR